MLVNNDEEIPVHVKNGCREYKGLFFLVQSSNEENVMDVLTDTLQTVRRWQTSTRFPSRPMMRFFGGATRHGCEQAQGGRN
jgi:hypothetical protein